MFLGHILDSGANGGRGCRGRGLCLAGQMFLNGGLTLWPLEDRVKCVAWAAGSSHCCQRVLAPGEVLKDQLPCLSFYTCLGTRGRLSPAGNS